MAYTESENLGLKIQDDDEFNSILVTAENFGKIDNSYGEMLKSIAEAAADSTKKFQAVNTALGGKAASGHKHTADDITETTEKKILTAEERTKLSGIATGATKNIVDQAKDGNSTNAVSNKIFSTWYDLLDSYTTSIAQTVTALMEYLSGQGNFADDNGTSGRLYLGEFLLQWGFVKKANSAAETVESVAVTFDQNYRYKVDNSYFAIATSISSVPQKIALGITSRKTTGFTINHYRTSTQKKHTVWLTVGRGAKNALEEIGQE